MKNILILILLAFTIVSCKSKKEVIVKDDKEMMSGEATDVREGVTRDGDQSLPNRPRRKAVDPEMIVAQLGLDEEKEKEFLGFWELHDEKIKALREKAKGDRTGMKEGMQMLKQERTDGIAKILSPEEMKQYEEIMKSQRRSRANKGKRRG